MKNPSDILERVEDALAELKDLPESTVVLVEGKKDKEALNDLGINSSIRMVQSSSKGIFAIAEDLSLTGKNAYILTDWDRKGGQLADLLRKALNANGVEYNDRVRAELSKLCRTGVKDVESLPSFLAFLRSKP